MFSPVQALVSVLALAAAGAYAQSITIYNACSFAVTLTLSNFPAANGVNYNGNTAINVGAYGNTRLGIPNGWDGRICDSPPNSGCQNNCFGGIAFGEAPCSMAEFNFKFGTVYYDISNIQGYSVPMMIQPTDGSCGTVMCQQAGCPCNQAYRPGDTSGTCGGSGPVDQAVRACNGQDYNLIMCP